MKNSMVLSKGEQWVLELGTVCGQLLKGLLEQIKNLKGMVRQISENLSY